MKTGSLVIVGTGIKLGGHVTAETQGYIEGADKVFFLVTDPAEEYWIRQLNSSSEDLSSFYGQDKARIDSYLEMVGRILSEVRKGLNVCAVFYGHPGVFVYPSHEAINQARSEGYRAMMLPGISAEDCLFADLNLDPASTGCQSFEATDFLVFRRQFDTSSSLIIWQIGVVGVLSYKKKLDNRNGLHILIDYLQEFYDGNHEVVIYEAAHYPVCDPTIERVPLAKVPESHVSAISTLYLPPKSLRPLDKQMLDRLGIDPNDIAITK